MKQKLFTLLTLALFFCSGVWAGEEFTITPSLSKNNATLGYGLVTITKAGTVGDCKFGSGKIQSSSSGKTFSFTVATTYAGVTIKSITFSSFENKSSFTCTGGSLNDAGTTFTPSGDKNTATFTYVPTSGKTGKLALSIVLDGGTNDIETISTFTGKTDNKFAFTTKKNGATVDNDVTISSADATASSNNISWGNTKVITISATENINFIGLNADEDITKGVSTDVTAYSNTAWNGTAKSISFTNSTGGGRTLYTIYLIKEAADSRTELTAAWSNAAPSFNVGSAATIPTFTVTGGTLGTDYTVAYSKTDASGIITLTGGNGPISAINTAAAATATVTATVTIVNTAEYKMATTSYDCAITVAVPVVPTPTLTAGGYFITDSKSVEIACEDGSATIKYSIDNGETWNNYTTALTLTETTTVKAKAIRDGYTDSEVASATYTKFVKSALAGTSTAKTWDFTKLTETLQLTASTLPVKDSEYFTYQDIGTLNSHSIPASFGDATAMAFKGEYPYRSAKSQAGYWKFHANVPGSIVVKFSDTGTSKSSTAVKRYLQVNGTKTEYWTSREKTGDGAYSAQLNVTTDPINVTEGDVIITGVGADGSTWQALVVTEIAFTPATASVSVGAKGYATYCNSNYALDFTDKSIKAYTISSTDGSALTLTQKNKVAKDEPVLLYSATNSDSQTIPAIAESEATADATNKLVAGDGNAHTWVENSTEHYVLYTGGDIPGFYRANNSNVAVGKAYLDLTDVEAHAFSFDLNLGEGDVTGIANVSSKNETMNGAIYDLQGRKVAQPAKGLYIVNGKKVIVK